MTLKYGYSSSRKNGKTTYTNRSGQSVSSSTANASGGTRNIGTGSIKVSNRSGRVISRSGGGSSGSPNIREVTTTATFSGRIKGNFYTGLTEKELVDNKLSPNSVAKIDGSRTRLITGVGNSRDLFNVVSGNRNTIDLSGQGVTSAIRTLKDLNNNSKVRQSIISAEQLSRFNTSTPVLTQGALLRILGRKLEGNPEYRIFRNSAGKVIGVQDPFSKKSYRVSGVTAKKLVRDFNDQQLTQEEAQRNFDKKQGKVRTLSTKTQSTISELRQTKSKLATEKAKLMSGKTFDDLRPSEVQLLRQTSVGISGINNRLTGLIIVGEVIKFADSIISIPATARYLWQNPAVIKSIPSAVWKDTKKGVSFIKTNPEEAILIGATNLVLMWGLGKAVSSIGKAINSGLVRLSPKFVGSLKVGNKLKIKLPKGKVVELKVAGSIPKSTLRKQVKLAGKKVNAISSQADRLLTLRNSTKRIRKPITARKGAKVITEAEFSPRTKKLLKLFDEGKLPKSKLNTLDQLIQKEGAKGILETSFFADPSGIIRPSRLGVLDKNAGVYDVLKGTFTIKKAKPQILLFSDVAVESFPKNLKLVANKISKGLPLTKKETTKLLSWQNTKSGKFKPVGFLSGESEITLAPNELLKRVKKVGVSIIDGKRVPIVQVKVIQAEGRLGSLLKKWRKTPQIREEISDLIKQIFREKRTLAKSSLKSTKKVQSIKTKITKLQSKLKVAKKTSITKKELSELSKRIKRKTGLDYNVSSYSNSKKYLSLGKYYTAVGKSLISIAKSLSSIKKSSKPSKTSKVSRRSKTSRTSKPSRTSRPSRTSKTSRTSRPSKTSKTSKPSKTSRPSKTSKPSKSSRGGSSKASKPSKTSKPKKPVKRIILNLNWKKKLPRGKVYIVNPIVRIRGRNIELKWKTTPNRARKMIESKIDRSTSRSYSLRIVGIKKGSDIKEKKLTRGFKFRKKKSNNRAVQRIVEKTRFLIDTSGEKRGLKLGKLLKTRRRVVKRKPQAKRKVVKRKKTKRKK